MTNVKQIKILVVDDERISLKNICHVLDKEGYKTESANSGGEAIKKLGDSPFDLVVTDLKMGDIDGFQVMETTKRLQPDTEVIIITGYATVNSAVEAMAKGAFYYIAKPLKLQQLKEIIHSALEKSLFKKELNKLKSTANLHPGSTQFIGQNTTILQLKDTIAQVAQLDCNVLITGETGTGKELVARIIHELSPRANKRFLPINCTALTEELMLNELFGHEKDAFTGASKARKGLLESAGGGVVLLDEVGETPLQMQVKLLRALQEKSIFRVGGTQEIPIDIRIIAATNRDLKEDVLQKTFRQDLYYRLNVVSLHIPALRERRDDIPALIRHFLAKYPSLDRQTKNISNEAVALLMDYNFPGNVRELENIIERTLATCTEAEIKPVHLPQEITTHERPLPQCTSPHDAPLKSLKNTEQQYILSVLQQANGNQSKAAEIMGISRVSLWRKLKKYQDEGVEIDQYLNPGK
ncbi:MAG: sigma-54 dependent transcriptional regulator [Desulfobacterales bacterium]